MLHMAAKEIMTASDICDAISIAAHLEMLPKCLVDWQIVARYLARPMDKRYCFHCIQQHSLNRAALFSWGIYAGMV